MADYLKPPMLSTSFSESGKKAKKRFENILTPTAKKRGFAALSVIAAAVLACGALAACSGENISIIGGADGPTAIYTSDSSEKELKRLFDNRQKYVGNASGVGAIIDGLDSSGKCGKATGMELQTSSEPYGIIRRFEGKAKDESELMRQSAVILALVDNAGYVTYKFTDGEYNYTRREMAEKFGASFGNAAKDYDSFKSFYQEVYGSRAQMSIDELVADAIISNGHGSYSEGECVAEGHVILGTENPESDGQPDKKIVYVMTSYGEYGFQNGAFVKVSGSGVIPVRITFDSNNKLLEYKMPMDGSYYASSIKEMFPKDMWKQALSESDSFYGECFAQEKAYAQKYLDKIGRKAEILENADTKLSDMDTEASNTLLDLYYDYPYWIGTEEKIENGVRCVYEKKWQSSGGGDGTVTYLKYEYGSEKVLEKTVIEVKKGKIKYIEGKLRTERK